MSDCLLNRWIGARIAILLPIPAGVGVLAASQILALGLVLFFRVRDIAWAL